MRALLLVLLTACGSSTPSSAPDAPAPVDGRPAGSGPITVNAPYLDANHQITPGATVLFYDADGALVDRVVTGADGRATGIATPESNVMVLPPTHDRRDYYSWYRVSPGDELYTERVTVADAKPARHVSVVIPYDEATTTQYTVSAVGLTAAATPPPSGPVALDATVDADAPSVGDLVGESWHADRPKFFTVQGVPLAAPVIDVRSSIWSSGATFRVPMTVPSNTASVIGYYSSLAAGRVLWQGAGSVNGPETQFDLPIETPGAYVGDGYALQVFVQPTGSPTFVATFNAPSVGVDPAKLASTADQVVDTNNSVTWRQASVAQYNMGIEVVLSGAAGSWHIVMPADRTSFTPPPVPADLELPPAMPDATVQYIGGNDPLGYAALRTDVDAFDPYHYAQVIPAHAGLYRAAHD